MGDVGSTPTYSTKPDKGTRVNSTGNKRVTPKNPHPFKGRMLLGCPGF